MAKVGRKPRETWREWCAPENRDKLVTRGELLIWIDRMERERRASVWYRRLARFPAWLVGAVLDGAVRLFTRLTFGKPKAKGETE